MNPFVIDVPKSILACLILGWVMVFYGYKGHRIGNYLVVTGTK